MIDRPIHLIDDDPAMLRALERSLRVSGYRVFTYASAERFLRQDLKKVEGCLLLDVAMPGMSGMELHEHLVSLRFPWPVILLTARGSIPMSVEAIKRGAFDFLEKPVELSELRKVLDRGLARASAVVEGRRRYADLEERFLTLTQREREVFEKVITGAPNKVIADELGIAEQTIKVHRMRLSAKLDCASVVDLVNVSRILGIGAEVPDDLSPSRADSTMVE